MWIKELKIAIIEKNVDKIDKLLKDIPQLEDSADMEESIYLLEEAANLLKSLQSTTQVAMIKIKKNIDFLRSTEHKHSKRIDIKF